MDTGVAYSHATPIIPSPGVQRAAIGPQHGFPNPTQPGASSISSSQDGSPTKPSPPLMRPPPGRRTLSHSTLSPSGSVASMAGAGGAPTGGITSRYALPPTAAALEATPTRRGTPPAALTNGASNAPSSSVSPVPLGARLSTLVNGERTKNSLQRFAPAASWLVAGASKIGSFVAGADGAVEAREGPTESVAIPEHSPPGIASDAHSSLETGSNPAPTSPAHDSAPLQPMGPPQTTPPRPPWPRPGVAQPSAATNAISTPPPAQSVPEATSSVPLSATPTFTGGSNKSSSGAALALLADSTAPEHSADAHGQPVASLNGSSGPSWFQPSPNQHAEGSFLTACMLLSMSCLCTACM